MTTDLRPLPGPACQLHSLPAMSESVVRLSPWPPTRWLKLTLKRHLSPQAKRTIKKAVNRVAGYRPSAAAAHVPAVQPATGTGLPLQAGDVVRVRSRAEIDATLDAWHALRGCGFLPEMERYCGTVQRVLKPVQRAVDERDYQVKKFNGVVLLDGVVCEGTALYGRCDRACFYFWRTEWLESMP